MVHTCFDFGCCVKLHHVSQDRSVIPEKKTGRTWATESALLQQAQILLCTCAYTHTHMCTHTCMHTHTHARAHTHTHMRTHTHTHAHTYAHTHRHFRLCSLPYATLIHCLHTVHAHNYCSHYPLQSLWLTISHTDSLSIQSTHTHNYCSNYPLQTLQLTVSNTDSLSIHSTCTQLLFPLPTSKSVVYHISQWFTVYT